jgi:hypothetical protein
MKFSALACFAFSALGSAVHAGSAESAIVAAMKLPDAPNYSWRTSIDDDARSYAIDGKTNRSDDLSLVEMPMVAAVRRRSARGASNSDNIVEAAFKGDEKVVLHVNDKWQTPDELRAAAEAALSNGRGGGGFYGGGSGRRGGGPGGRGGRGGRGDGSVPPYSNLQQTLSRPHEEVAILVANAVDLKAEPDGLSGALSDTGAKLLLVHPGQSELTPLQGAGTFRFWIKDGVLVRYDVKLQGVVAVSANGTRREVAVNQTSSTTLSAIGTTSFEIPEDARKKLAAGT